MFEHKQASESSGGPHTIVLAQVERLVLLTRFLVEGLNFGDWECDLLRKWAVQVSSYGNRLDLHPMTDALEEGNVSRRRD